METPFVFLKALFSAAVVAAFFSLFVVPLAWAGQSGVPAPGNADRLYANRDDLPSAERAATLWEERLVSNPRDFEAAWKLSRARYWLGGHVGEDERREQYEQGIAVARRANAMEPDRPEGHFWMAASMGALAESFGLRAGLRYRGPIREQLEIVLGLDPAFQQGSADRALGRWYFKVPGLFGGNDDRAVEHLERSLAYNPESTATLFFLAETLLEMERIEEARTRLEQVLAAPLDPEWAPEDREFKAQAQELFKTLQP
ncbi:MAG: TRAP transporter TatT component family protein [Dehalococcoidia bacterium]